MQAVKNIEPKIIDRLKNTLQPHEGPFTVADVATKSGLSFSEVKSGLNYLLAEYRGNLAATNTGEILYSFPSGFSKPWANKERFSAFMARVKKGVLGGLKFLVRAWISIVMVGYVAIFALIILAMSFSKNSDRDDSPSLSQSLMFHTLLRLVLDSLFWTFHPFSPFRVTSDHYQQFGHYRAKPKMPFYERVNRFFFGPEEKPVDINDTIKLVLQEIRAKKGRIGIFDIMRITGLSKEEADPFMASLMLSYEGEVLVSEDGGIFYEFPALRKSAKEEISYAVPAIWQTKEKMPPFTGNPISSNLLIICLNGFNLLMSSIAISSSWTLEKINHLFNVAGSNTPPGLLPPPIHGTPLLLGWIPFIFSLSLFLIPAIRALTRGKKQKEIDEKNGRRGLIRAILSKLKEGGIKEDTLKKAWSEQAGKEPSDKQLIQAVVKLGGEFELNEASAPLYRFKALEAELHALDDARQKASHSEVEVGEVVFSSAK